MSETPPAADPGRAARVSTYTVEQLAELLQCSARHIWRLSDQNKIPGKLRIGRLVRFSRPQVDSWLAGQAKPTR